MTQSFLPPYVIPSHLRPFYQLASQMPSSPNEYRELCMQVLKVHAKSRPNLDVVAREMERMDILIRAYQLAEEFANTPKTDETPAHPLRPVIMQDKVRAFAPSRFVQAVLQVTRIEVEQLPFQFSCADREQVAQLAGISCAHFCTLSYVRPFVKRMAWMKKTGQDDWAPEIVAGEPVRYRSNALVAHWAQVYPDLLRNLPTAEQVLIQQLSGAQVGCP